MWGLHVFERQLPRTYSHSGPFYARGALPQIVFDKNLNPNHITSHVACIQVITACVSENALVLVPKIMRHWRNDNRCVMKTLRLHCGVRIWSYLLLAILLLAEVTLQGSHLELSSLGDSAES